jgi:type II secretory pathway pseudopilin PulG
MKMTLHPSGNRLRVRAYSLVEVMIGSAILMIGVAAACVLSLTMVTQEEGNVRASRALNVFENSMQLYQLGLSTSEVLALLPADPAVVALTLTPNTSAVAGIGTPERIDAQMQFTTMINTEPSDGTSIAWSAGKWTGGANGTAHNRLTEVIAVYRPATRSSGL